MSQREQRDDKTSFLAAPVNITAAWMNMFTAPFHSTSDDVSGNKEQSDSTGLPEITGWDISTKRDIKELIDEDLIGEPSKYDFDLREMKKFIKAYRKSEGSNSFKPDRREGRDLRNGDSPSGVDFYETVKGNPSAFYELEKVRSTQVMIESVFESEYWEPCQNMQGILEEFEELMGSGESSVTLEGEDGDYMEVFFYADMELNTEVELVYSAQETEYRESLGEVDHETLPQKLDELVIN